MTLQDDAAYRAMTTRDARFDGRLFIGVTSTKVYCRPVCRVRTPRRENCPSSPMRHSPRIGRLPCAAAPSWPRAVADGFVAGAGRLHADRAGCAWGNEMARSGAGARLGITDRHLRRISRSCTGGADHYLTTQRLPLAATADRTPMPVTQVALVAATQPAPFTARSRHATG
jgi:AraC family transcriptional regulator of adaptative response / DNA-3-methyladenine glycosylase II